jgi:hypothetical protein
MHLLTMFLARIGVDGLIFTVLIRIKCICFFNPDALMKSQNPINKKMSYEGILVCIGGVYK